MSKHICQRPKDLSLQIVETQLLSALVTGITSHAIGLVSRQAETLWVCGQALAELSQLAKRLQGKKVHSPLCSVKLYTTKTCGGLRYTSQTQDLLISALSEVRQTASCHGRFSKGNSLRGPLERKLNWSQGWSRDNEPDRHLQNRFFLSSSPRINHYSD